MGSVYGRSGLKKSEVEVFIPPDSLLWIGCASLLKVTASVKCPSLCSHTLGVLESTPSLAASNSDKASFLLLPTSYCVGVCFPPKPNFVNGVLTILNFPCFTHLDYDFYFLPGLWLIQIHNTC